ncbi:hypothetical protein P9112_011136 [Eukaryota sp. TZLM1-RC]
MDEFASEPVTTDVDESFTATIYRSIHNTDWEEIGKGNVHYDVANTTLTVTSTDNVQLISSKLSDWNSIGTITRNVSTWFDDASGTPIEYALALPTTEANYSLCSSIAQSFGAHLDPAYFEDVEEETIAHTTEPGQAELEPLTLPPCTCEGLSELVTIAQQPHLFALAYTLSIDNGSYLGALLKLVVSLLPSGPDLETSFLLISEDSLDYISKTCYLVKRLFSSSRLDICDVLLSEEIFTNICVILSFDPLTPSNHRIDLTSEVPVIMNVLGIELSPEIMSLYRKISYLEYLKDVVFPVSLEESVLLTLNAFSIGFQRDFISFVVKSEDFISNLTKLVSSSDKMEVFNGLNGLLELSNFAKNLISLGESELLVVKLIQSEILNLLEVHFSLLLDESSRTSETIKNALTCVEVLRNFVNINFTSIRHYYAIANSDTLLINTLLSILVEDINEDQDGISALRSQILEIFQILLDDHLFISESAFITKFLINFKNNSLPIVLKVFENISVESVEACHNLSGISNGLCIFSFLLNPRSAYRTKLIFLETKLLLKASPLLNGPFKLKVGYLRLFRKFLSVGDDFVVNHAIRLDLFSGIVDLFSKIYHTDNVLTSTILSLFQILLPINTSLGPSLEDQDSQTLALSRNYLPLIKHLVTNYPQLKVISQSIPIINSLFEVNLE